MTDRLCFQDLDRGRAIGEYAEFQFRVWDDEREVVGAGNAIPAAWDGDAASACGTKDSTTRPMWLRGGRGDLALRLRVLAARKRALVLVLDRSHVGLRDDVAELANSSVPAGQQGLTPV